MPNDATKSSRAEKSIVQTFSKVTAFVALGVAVAGFVVLNSGGLAGGFQSLFIYFPIALLLAYTSLLLAVIGKARKQRKFGNSLPLRTGFKAAIWSAVLVVSFVSVYLHATSANEIGTFFEGNEVFKVLQLPLAFSSFILFFIAPIFVSYYLALYIGKKSTNV